MKKFIPLAVTIIASLAANAQSYENRLLVASQTRKILPSGNVTYSDGFEKEFLNCDFPLVSWRMLPDDTEKTCFDLYRTEIATGMRKLVNDKPIYATNYRDLKAPMGKAFTYTLTYHGSEQTIGEYTMYKKQSEERLPYISIKLKDYEYLKLDTFTFTDPLDATKTMSFAYEVGDGSVGDLDGDGEPEIVVKRHLNRDHQSVPGSMDVVRHAMLIDAYKMDGTFLWRLHMGPNTHYGNIESITIADFNGDGCDEVALHTAEGVIFGDGQEIGDTNGDGKTDYRTYIDTYLHMEPEFLSVVDGKTGAEIARTDYIPIKNSEEYGDGYFKRAHSQRIYQGLMGGKNPSIGIIRGCYAKIAIEAFDLDGNTLVKRWHFDTDSAKYASYRGQGNHNLRMGDIDGDGYDELVYGAIGIDHDGHALYSTNLGHGDAMHMGKFSKDKDGLQVWSCFETGKTNAAYRDAASGATLWNDMANTEGDCGRCMIADIDPNNDGYEMWIYRGNARNDAGEDLGYTGMSSNSGVWFGPYINRALQTGVTLDAWSPKANAMWRLFTVYRYDVSCASATKDNTVLTGDILGDWREEMVYASSDQKELWIFNTWFATDYRFPYLRSDHTYELSLQNQNVGYNQPTHLGCYFASDMPLEDKNVPSSIENIENKHDNTKSSATLYNMAGQRVDRNYKGVVAEKGKRHLTIRRQ